jgi:hypothetical protein
MMEVAARHHGIVILHDVAVHELCFYTMQRGGDARGRYLKALSTSGAAAVEAGREVLAGRLDLRAAAVRFPLSAWALRDAHGVVSHNAAALSEALPGLRLPLLDVPLPWLPLNAMAPERAHVRPEGALLELVICGYLNSPSRRLDEVLTALAAYPQKERLLLHIAGGLADPSVLLARVRELGLSMQVKFHGYLSESALAKLLERAHLALNLRWPSVGEASGAQLRFWNHSLPTAVTRTGWYARQTAESVLFVDPQGERGDLWRIWDRALADAAGIAALGLAGRRHLAARHGAEVFAAALADFLPSVAAFRGTAFEEALARRAGRAVAALDLPEAARNGLCTRAADAISRLDR